MANSNFVVHNGLTVGPLSIDAATGALSTSGTITSTSSSAASFSGNIVAGSGTASTSLTTGALVVSGSGGLGVGGQVTAGNLVSISGSTIAYLDAEGSLGYVGTASNHQFNFTINKQVPAFIAANGSVIITGNTSLESGGAGNLFVRNNTGSAVGMAITDATSFHIGSVTNSQFNLKQNNTTQAYIDTTGNVNVVNSLIVAGSLKVTGTITTSGSSNIVTDNKNLVLANNQSTGAGVDGSGILLGNNSVVTWTYNNASNAWRSNVNILPTTNNTLNLGGSSNYWNTIYVGTVTASGGISGTTGTFSGAVSPSANASVNLGTTSNYWNNVYAVNFLGTSTTAKYADLAERYRSDADYEPGTVVDFGGHAEITLSTIDGSQYVAGVISTNPAYLMNDNDPSMLPVALVGRVPCKVTGPIQKGAMLVSNGDGSARMERYPVIGSVLGKALESFGDGTGVIEVVVGRL